mmetsp:Transcript_28822/g.65944  ORF Transcript_28822/g.65944 Transcript_28822/m.65944 type:complete len:312 (-) Transcript_28822:371-1306(-)
MVRTGAERFFPTNERGIIFASEHFFGIHQISKVLPSGGSFEQIEPSFLRDKIDRSGSRHGTRDALQSSLRRYERNAIGIVGDDGQRVGRRDEELAAQNHVPVGVAVGGRAETGDRFLPDVDLFSFGIQAHQGDEFLRVGQVGIGVSSVEVVFGHRVHAHAYILAEFVDEHCFGVGSVHSVHAVINHREVRSIQKCLDRRKIKNRLQKSHMRFCRIDDFDGHAFHLGCSNFRQVDLGHLLHLPVRFDLCRVFEYSVGEFLGSGLPVLAVELNSEVLLRSARVVRGGQDESSERRLPLRAALANDGGHGGGAQ